MKAKKIEMKPWVILLVLVIVAIMIVVFVGKNKPQPTVTENEGIVIQNIVNNQEIVSPLSIKGSVKGNGWSSFEAVCGRVDLVGDDGKTVIASSRLDAISNWMELPVSFAATLNFEIKSTIDGSLIFYNENPSGDPQRDKTLKIPVKISPSINFNKTGNLVINNPGLEKNIWYLVYDVPGHPASKAKLEFDERSECTDGCSNLSAGDRVTIFGIEKDGIVLVRKLEQL